MRNDDAAVDAQRIEDGLHDHLEHALSHTAWRSGASEAHGLLTALACRGVCTEQVRAKAHLLQLSQPRDLELIEGVHGIALRALTSDEFAFQLLLPDTDGDGNNSARRIEALANWCGGFLQGFWHDREGMHDDLPAPVREALDDIAALSRIDLLANDDANDEDAARQAVEIEEYLRVAAQTIFDALNDSADVDSTAH